MNSNVKEEIEKYWEERESLNFSDPDINCLLYTSDAATTEAV